MVRCCIVGCVNRGATPQGHVYAFPTSTKEVLKRRRDIFMQFYQSIPGSVELKSLQGWGICELHFTNDSFEDRNGHKRLKIDACPTITEANEIQFLPSGRPTTSFVLQTFNKMSTGPEAECALLRKQLYDAEVKCREMERQNEENQKKIQALEKDCKERDEKMASMKSDMEEVLSRFTSGQQRMLLNPSLSRIHWEEEDVNHALQLFVQSKKAYELVRSEWGIPLPSQTKLLETLRNIDVEPNKIFPGVLRLLNQKAFNCENPKTLCTLTYDEMAIDSTLCYDQALDQVFGHHKDVTVFCLRGLFEKWKIPLMYTFSQSVQQVTEIIKVLYDNGFQVVGCVSDQGPKNQGFLRDLKVGKVKNRIVQSVSFEHPHDAISDPIFVFPDFIHLLKSLRNNFNDTGLTLWDGTLFDQSWIKELIRLLKINGDLKIHQKLGPKHLYQRGQQRQNARTAFELFSRKTATAIRILMSHRMGYETVCTFIEIIDDLSNLCNVHTPHESADPFQNGFGKNIDSQMELLSRAEDCFSTMKIGEKNALKPFQKGFIMYIQSLRGLYNYLKNRYQHFQYILTSHLTQDYVESLFSEIRGTGGFNQNPTAVDFRYRIRKMILKWAEGFSFEDDTSVLSCLLDAKTKEPCSCEIPVNYESNIEARLQALETELDMTKQYNIKEMSKEDIVVEGGMEYVAGFIAMKLMEKVPELCKDVSNENERHFWIYELSRGGLVEPADYWFALFRKWEEYFCTIHPNGQLNKDRHIVQRLCNKLLEFFPEVPMNVILYYARLRTFIRIRTLNKMVEDKKFYDQEYSRTGKDPEAEDEPKESTEGEALIFNLEALLNSAFFKNQ